MHATAPRASRRRLAATCAALVTAAAGVAGCASSSGAGGGADPAAVVPATAPLYVEAVVGDGADRRDADAALARVLRTTDPRGALARLLDRATPGTRARFARDVEPWIGDRVAAAALSFGRRDGDKLLVAASRDDAKAEAALGRIAPDAQGRSYRGVDYRYEARARKAAAVVGDTVVLGSENGVKAAVDASKGASLAEADALKTARGSVSQERSGFLYLDVAGVLRETLAGAGGAAAQAAPFIAPVAQALPATVGAALDAEPDLLRVDSAAFGNGGGPAPAPGGADALAALPGDAWLGLGVGDLGGTVGALLARIASAGGIAGVGVEAVLGQAQQRLGLDIRRDLLAWMGNAGVFVAGTSSGGARSALVVASKDAAATRRAVAALGRAARRGGRVTSLRAPGVDEGFVLRRRGDAHPLFVAAGGDRFVVASGRHALGEALRPPTALGDRAAFRSAAARLGGGVRPSFFLDVPRLTRAAAAEDRSGAHGRAAREYLGAFGAVAAGAVRDGDTTRGRAVVTLR